VVGGTKILYKDVPLLESGTRLQAQDLVPSVLVGKYRGRNLTTHAVGEYVWTRAPPRAADAKVSYPNFNLTATIRFPHVPVLYTPDVAEVLKTAWIQYLSMLVLVLFLLNRLCSFVFYHQVCAVLLHSSSRL
jgi:hypothetical protein